MNYVKKDKNIFKKKCLFFFNRELAKLWTYPTTNQFQLKEKKYAKMHRNRTPKYD